MSQLPVVVAIVGVKNLVSAVRRADYVAPFASPPFNLDSPPLVLDGVPFHFAVVGVLVFIIRHLNDHPKVPP